ncbi:MAG TPA: flagellar basal body-associated FliL family protein [Thermodesulfobacteriota bacterium]|nr:flagellar basal body-associated FliL family protein [Thermodesulfobacteriota bacterium]
MEQQENKKPPRTLKILILAGCAVVVLAGGAVGLLALAPTGGDGSFFGKLIGHRAAEKPHGPGHIYKMEPILVNLADPGQLHYLKVTLHLEDSQEKPNAEYEKRLPQLRDSILTILSSKTHKEIMTAEGKTALREEIKGRMNQILASFKVRNIYFTEFVVQ